MTPTTTARTPEAVARAARLLSRDPDQVRDLPWGTAHAVFDASPELAAVMTREDLDDWLDCSLLHYPVLNAIRGATPVPPQELTRTMTVSGDPRGGYVDGAKVRARLRDGATVVVQNLHEWHRPAREMCRRAAELFEAKAGAVAFWSPPGEAGLRVHRDDGHLFVVQISGTKRWYLYDTPAAPGLWEPGYVEAPDALAQPATVDLRAGQVLYLPDGIAHHTETLDEESVHVTVAVREPALRDIAELAVRACLARVPAHATAAAADREEAVAAVLDDLAAALGRVDRAALARHVTRRSVQTGGSR
ncbi:JmjC domain-containing protein [Streptomyces pristinaespiralis]|uniref:JmjC domain-containing protein n=1 Tax=Streptomyces pristinaespiralis TaxID=38300 RepID=UPI0033FA43A0